MKPGLQIASGLFIISKRDFRWRRVNIQAVYKVVYKATRQANEVSKCSFWSLLIDNYFFPRKTKKELPYVGGIWTHNTLLSRWALYQPCYQGCYWFKPPTQVKANIKAYLFPRRPHVPTSSLRHFYFLHSSNFGTVLYMEMELGTHAYYMICKRNRQLLRHFTPRTCEEWRRNIVCMCITLLKWMKSTKVQTLGELLHCLRYIARLRFTLRWEGMAASTNCSSNVNCCATLRTYLAQFIIHREQRSTMTEERNSKTACSSKVN